MNELYRINKFIKENDWIFAKSYAKTYPHEYVCKDDLSKEMQKEFEWFVEQINQKGKLKRFWRKTDKYLEIGKVGTGIKEKSEQGISFGELTEKIKPLIVDEKGKQVKIKPKIIVSVTYQEIQKSPNYNSGFALRFPRFTALRTDKPLSEISDLDEIEKDFEKQKRNYRYG